MTDIELVKELRHIHRDGTWNAKQPDAPHPLCTKAADRIEAQAAEIERLHRALRRYGRHLIGENPCDLYANSTRSCTCGLTDDLKWS